MIGLPRDGKDTKELNSESASVASTRCSLQRRIPRAEKPRFAHVHRDISRSLMYIYTLGCAAPRRAVHLLRGIGVRVI